ALRHQDEGKEAAGQRLGLVAKALVDPAAALFAQENAAAIGAMVELVAPGPGRPHPLERRQPAQVPVPVPALRLDAAALLIGDGDLVFLAAGAADVAVPVLQDWEMADGERHQQPGERGRQQGESDDFPVLYSLRNRDATGRCKVPGDPLTKRE